MKTVFSVLISYILLLLFGTSFIALLIMAYFGCARYVVGQSLNLYSFESLFFGIRIGFPVMLIFSQMFLILSLIRHSKKNWLAGIISIAVLNVLSWGFLFPAFFKVSGEVSYIHLLEKNKLSPGYFRISQNELFYFTHVDSTKSEDGIRINIRDLSTEDSAFSVFKKQNIKFPETGIFSDILVKNILDYPKFLTVIMNDFSKIFLEAKRTFLNSIKDWLFFCSFGVALFFVFGVAKISNWRLVNVVLVIVSTLIVVISNVVCRGLSLYNKYFLFIENLNEKIKSSITFFQDVSYPICFFVNAFFIICFVILKIVFYFKNKKVGEEL